MRMRLRPALVGLLVAPALIALAACAPGGPAGQESDSGTSSSDTTTGTTETTASSTPSNLGPAIPAETAVAPAVDRARMPTASGVFGDKPTIAVPSTPPPDTLQRVVLSDGDGPKAVAGDWLQVNYLGQVWGGKVFDNSYDKGSPFTIQVGAQQPMVVAGWDVGLRGVTQGSRVLLSFPPQDGYGAAGRAPDISGTDTLIFVVDVLKVLGSDAAGQSDAVVQTTAAGLPTVGGDLGREPSISVPTSLPAPTEATVTVLAKGTGSPAVAGNILVQYVATTWDGSQTEKSWPDPTGKDPYAGSGPQSFPLAEGSPLAGLIGVPIGSRVLLTTPADTTSQMPALAWVVDLILQQDTSTAGGS